MKRAVSVFLVAAGDGTNSRQGHPEGREEYEGGHAVRHGDNLVPVLAQRRREQVSKRTIILGEQQPTRGNLAKSLFEARNASGGRKVLRRRLHGPITLHERCPASRPLHASTRMVGRSTPTEHHPDSVTVAPRRFSPGLRDELAWLGCREGRRSRPESLRSRGGECRCRGIRSWGLRWAVAGRAWKCS